MNGFKFISLTEKEHFVRDRPEKLIYNALIITLPKNEIMKKCIYQIVKNVKNKYYGRCPLFPTGPGLVGNYFTSEERNNLGLHFTAEGDEENCIFLNNKLILKNYSEYREEQIKHQNKKRYLILWQEKNIYA
jgi:hypothetical protein